ncbi:SRPBCC family protein [Novosphingobium resinovorum]|uniref:SRPBCC family protein n=1 Tax=Novosphingobium TaxID=165696 RepID=UPI001B3C8E0E|nr:MULTISPECIES: SRPBCC family protein [Novosphingobium]MBF7013833.1 SRPBCC family protein [Novosphingobium sp. HR1a]WJM25977.1 SRPBCC family protein [Novosphingobium resinovorum]
MDDIRGDAPLTTSKHRHLTGDAAQLGIEAKGGSLISRSVTINRPREELYAFWRDFSNLTTFMENIQRVDEIDGRTSHWVVLAPGGRTVEWDAAITRDVPGECIAWASAEGADIANSGSVEFRDAGPRGTVITATIDYAPPAGLLGRAIAKLFQREPAIQARRDLRRFKQLMETGEVATAARTRTQLIEETA